MKPEDRAALDKMIGDSITNLTKKSDDELMSLYCLQAFKRYPSLVEIQALEIMFKNRKIELKNIDMVVNYIDESGVKSVKVATI